MALDDSYYMKQALLEAHKAGERGEVPVGAVVVCKDRIIARAHNLTETLTDVTAHAEMQAITAAAATLGGKYLNECTLYVTVEPCVMCAGAIAWAQMGRLVFGAEDEKRGYQRYASQALHPKTQVVKGILADECAALMKEFLCRQAQIISNPLSLISYSLISSNPHTLPRLWRTVSCGGGVFHLLQFVPPQTIVYYHCRNTLPAGNYHFPFW